MEASFEKRVVSGVRGDVKMGSAAELLVAAKKDKDDLDKQYERMALAASAAANRRAK